MGARGPLPQKGIKRRNDRQIDMDTSGVSGQGKESPFEPDPEWHPIATSFYLGLERSGQSKWYEESDWAIAYVAAENLSRALKPQFLGMGEKVEVIEVNGREETFVVKKPVAGTVPIKGSDLAALNAVFQKLLVTEGDRRRVNIELQAAGKGANAEDEATRQARLDAEMVEAMRGGNVVPFAKPASGE